MCRRNQGWASWDQLDVWVSAMHGLQYADHNPMFESISSPPWLQMEEMR